MADFTLAIVNWNTRDLLRRCLQSIAAYSGGYDVQVLVADNASDDGSAEMVEAEFPQATLIRTGGNLGFARGHESLFPLGTGRYHVLVNSDVELTAGCLRALDERMRGDESIGVLGPQIVDGDGRVQPSCRRFPTLARQLAEASGLATVFPRGPLGSYRMGDFDHATPADVDQVMGSFFLIRSTLLSEVGTLDTRFFMYYEEVDYCLRARDHGYRVFFDPAARVIHHGGGSSRHVRVETIRRRMRSMHHYFRKHRGPWVTLPLSAICALDALTHVVHALVTRREPARTARAYALGVWDVITVKPSWEEVEHA